MVNGGLKRLRRGREEGIGGVQWRSWPWRAETRSYSQCSNTRSCPKLGAFRAQTIIIMSRPLFESARLRPIESGGVRLAVREWGDTRRPTLVLVHGYPDNSEVWAEMVPLLAGDFHVVTYDVRGAGDSDRPARTADYRLAQLSADFKAVIDAVSPDRPVHVVAHDWGSVQSWESVTDPALRTRVASYTTCSGPCLDHMGHWLRERYQQPTLAHVAQLLKQGLKSWYVYFFHLPLLPTLLWRLLYGPLWPLYLRLTEGLRIARNPHQTADGLYGMKLYRANVFPTLAAPRERQAQAPVLLLVALRDAYISPALAEGCARRWAPQLTVQHIDSGHWLPLSQPQTMADAVRGFVQNVEAARV